MIRGNENHSRLDRADAEERKRHIKMSNDLLNALRQYETPPSSLQFREGVMLGFIPYREGMFGSPAAMCGELADPMEEERERHKINQRAYYNRHQEVLRLKRIERYERSKERENDVG